MILATVQILVAFTSAAVGAHLMSVGRYEFAATQFVCTVLMLGLVLKGPPRC